jgi:Rne/Rng family ribonuclease
MITALVIAAGPGEWRAAWLEDGVAAELHVERGDPYPLASLHLGRVVRLVPALGAVLVDIGAERPGFLPQSDIAGKAPPAEGASLLVQIRREAQGGKAARLTTRIRLQARGIELRIGGSGWDMSGIADDNHPHLLAALGDGAGLGLRLRDPGAPSPPLDDLIAATASLRREWQALSAQAAQSDPPRRLDRQAGFAAALAARLPGRPQSVLVDDPAAIPELRACFADVPVELAGPEDMPIDIAAAIDGAIGPRVALAGGGLLHIAETRAGVLIDIDTGTPVGGTQHAAGLATNRAAAREIGRQIRLRNLGGGIVIDFVGLDGRGWRQGVGAALAAALAGDPAQPVALGWTRLGHFELTRPRRGRPLSETLLDGAHDDSMRKSALTIAHEALAAVLREARARPAARWQLCVAPSVAASLAADAAAARRTLEERLGRAITLRSEPDRAPDRFEIVAL